MIQPWPLLASTQSNSSSITAIMVLVGSAAPPSVNVSSSLCRHDCNDVCMLIEQIMQSVAVHRLLSKGGRQAYPSALVRFRREHTESILPLPFFKSLGGVLTAPNHWPLERPLPILSLYRPVSKGLSPKGLPWVAESSQTMATSYLIPDERDLTTLVPQTMCAPH